MRNRQKGVESVSEGLQQIHNGSNNSVSITGSVSETSSNLKGFSKDLKHIVSRLDEIVSGIKTAQTQKKKLNKKSKPDTDQKLSQAA